MKKLNNGKPSYVKIVQRKTYNVMFQAIISGFILGLTIAVILGSAFFSLIQTSISKGFRTAMFMAIGLSLSDITLILLSFFGISQLISGDKYRVVFGIMGGLILLIYGVFTFRKKNAFAEINETDMDEDKKYMKIKAPRPVLYVIKGYFLSLFNPFVLIFWMGIMGYMTAEYKSNTERLSVFFATTLITVFATDLLKCYLANQLKRFLKTSVLSFINHMVGIILFAFGVYLIIKTLIFF